MPPDVRPVFWGVGNPAVGNPTVGVQAEDSEGPLHRLPVAQFDLVAPLDEVSDSSWFNLRRTHGVSVPSIQPPA